MIILHLGNHDSGFRIKSRISGCLFHPFLFSKKQVYIIFPKLKKKSFHKEGETFKNFNSIKNDNAINFRITIRYTQRHTKLETAYFNVIYKAFMCY